MHSFKALDPKCPQKHGHYLSISTCQRHQHRWHYWDRGKLAKTFGNVFRNVLVIIPSTQEIHIVGTVLIPAMLGIKLSKCPDTLRDHVSHFWWTYDYLVDDKVFKVIVMRGSLRKRIPEHHILRKLIKNKPTIVVSAQLFCNDKSYDTLRYGSYRIHMGQALIIEVLQDLSRSHSPLWLTSFGWNTL